MLNTPHDRFDAAFTVDVEDYFQVAAFEREITREQWDDFPCRVVPNTQRILALLKRRQVRGTFFVLGWIADRFPDLVLEIHSQGHEVGSHGYWHRRIYEQSAEDFRADLRRSREAIATVIGAQPSVYRAPTFSITSQTPWALSILAQEGFQVDSSIFPIHHDRYGIAGAPRELHQQQTDAGPIWEFPPTVARFGRLNVPVSGGGYFRLFPLRMTTYCLARTARRSIQPLMFYIHPWEVDPDQPRLADGSRFSRFRHYVNLRTTEAKLDRLLQRFRFGRVSDIVRAASEDAAKPS